MKRRCLILASPLLRNTGTHGDPVTPNGRLLENYFMCPASVTFLTYAQPPTWRGVPGVMGIPYMVTPLFKPRANHAVNLRTMSVRLVIVVYITWPNAQLVLVSTRNTFPKHPSRFLFAPIVCGNGSNFLVPAQAKYYYFIKKLPLLLCPLMLRPLPSCTTIQEALSNTFFVVTLPLRSRLYMPSRVTVHLVFHP